MPKYLDPEGVAYLWNRINNNITNKVTYYSKTKNEWDSDINIISEKDSFYIYSDYKTIHKDDKDFLLPGLKIGDGKTYLIDLPFMNADNSQFEQRLLDHINNNIIHVTLQEKTFWNNKLNYEFNNDETLVFNKN